MDEKSKRHDLEIRDVQKSLQMICDEYGISVEIAKNMRAKLNSSVQDWTGGGDLITDPAAFDSKDVGYVIILKGVTKEVYDNKLTELRKKILLGKFNVAVIWIEVKT